MAAKSPPENKFGSFNKDSKTWSEVPEKAFILAIKEELMRVDYKIRSLEFSLCGRTREL